MRVQKTCYLSTKPFRYFRCKQTERKGGRVHGIIVIVNNEAVMKQIVVYFVRVKVGSVEICSTCRYEDHTRKPPLEP